MKKFTFSLQRLLGYKEQLFEAELTALGEMRAVLADLEEELERMQAEGEQRASQFRAKAQRGMPIMEAQSHKRYMTVLDAAIMQKLQQIEMQKNAVERQAEKVRQAKIDISAMEKLRERKLEQYKQDAAKAEEIFIEEFVTNAKISEVAS